MKRINKKGLSPAIATALLISLALILAALIFIWANSFLKEKIQKFEKPIENACEQISFQAEVYSDELHVVNRENIPIQSFEVKKKTESSIISLGTAQVSSGGSIGNGETSVIPLPVSWSISNGDELVISPIIYGLEGGQRTPYTCSDIGSVTVKAG